MPYEGMNCYEGKEESNVALHYWPYLYRETKTSSDEDFD